MNESEKALFSLVQDTVLEILSKQYTLSLEQSVQIAQACIEHSKQLQIKTCVALCDPHGNPILFYRMEGALLVSTELAPKKAYTAVSLNMSTEEAKQFMDRYTPHLDQATENKLVFFGGGFPIRINKQLIGGLGVSGGLPEQDQTIATYGLKSAGLL